MATQQKQQSVIVFGGSSGIGEGTAHLLVRQGYSVTIVGRDQAKIDAALARINANLAAGTTPATGAAVDATKRAELDAFFAKRKYDHIVLNQGGPKGSGPFRTLSIDDLRVAIEEKLISQLQTAQAALPNLNPTGSITFVGGAASRAHLLGTAGWAALNGGLDSITVSLARELAPIRVNLVSPGAVDTPAWAGYGTATKEAIFAGLTKTLPAGRVGQPSDIASAVLFLVQNTFTTGIVLDVNGGAHVPLTPQ